MATLICIALAAFFIIGLCIRMRVKIRLRVARGQSNASLELRFFYSLIRLRVRLVLFYRRGENLELVRLKRTGERKCRRSAKTTRFFALGVRKISVRLSHFVESYRFIISGFIPRHER